jgi:hypothetical protein
MANAQNSDLTKSEETLVRRLGLALSTEWNSLPPYAQDQLLDQACELEAWPAGVEIREALKAFVKHDDSDPCLDDLLDDDT